MTTHEAVWLSQLVADASALSIRTGKSMAEAISEVKAEQDDRMLDLLDNRRGRLDLVVERLAREVYERIRRETQAEGHNPRSSPNRDGRD